MTQDQLAVKAGIDSSNIRSYESGRAMMNISSLVRIAEALEVEPGELLEGVTSEMFGAPRAAAPSRPPLTPPRSLRSPLRSVRVRRPPYPRHGNTA